jgi:hypothetical protein
MIYATISVNSVVSMLSTVFGLLTLDPSPKVVLPDEYFLKKFVLFPELNSGSWILIF